jgi:hypothetical protein
MAGGVDGSSPSEGSAKAPQTGLFLSIELLPAQRAVGVELEMEPSRRKVRFRHVPSERNARLDTGAYAAPMSNLNDPRQATADGIAAARVGERAGAAGPGGCEHCDGECPAAHGSTMTARPVGANHPDALRRGDPRTALVIVFGAEVSGSLAPVVAELAGT